MPAKTAWAWSNSNSWSTVSSWGSGQGSWNIYQELRGVKSPREALELDPSASGDAAAAVAHRVAKFPPPHPAKAGEVLLAALRDSRLTVKGGSKALWAASRMQPWSPGQEGRPALHGCAQRLAEKFDAAGVAIALNAFATLKEWPPASLLVALRTKVPTQGQDVANCLWAAAKLRLELGSETLEALAEAAGAAWLTAPEVSMSIWALASLSCEGRIDNLQAQVPDLVPYLNAQGISNTAWGLSKLECKVNRELRSSLEARAVEVLPHASPQAVANTAVGLVRGCGNKGAAARYAQHVAEGGHLKRLAAKDLAELAWCLGSTEHAQSSVIDAMWTAVAGVAQNVDWQDLGHFQYCHRKHGRCPMDLHAELGKVGIASIEAANTYSDAAEVEVLNLLMRALEGKSGRVLIAGDSSGSFAVALQIHGFAVETWSRFSGLGGRGRSRPRAGLGQFDLCVVRIPAARAALTCLVSCLQPYCAGRPVLFAGRREEGIFSLHSALVLPEEQVLFEDSSGAVVRAVGPLPRDGVCQGTSLGRTSLNLELDQVVPWTLYPGLFAGGTVDIMTSKLLEVLPSFPKKSRVLDFCCGSGVIAAVVRQRCPTADVHALDADALAVRAAKKNLPDAHCWLSDCWTTLYEQGIEEFDFVLSNPPVHRGLISDFRVLQNFLRDVSSWLTPRGVVMFVVQSYIPIESLLKKVTLRQASAVYSDGRFIVWQASASRKRRRDVNS